MSSPCFRSLICCVRWFFFSFLLSLICCVALPRVCTRANERMAAAVARLATNAVNFMHFVLQFSQWMDGWQRLLCVWCVAYAPNNWKIGYIVDRGECARCSSVDCWPLTFAMICEWSDTSASSPQRWRSQRQTSVYDSLPWRWLRNKQTKKKSTMLEMITYSVRIGITDAAARWHFPKSINLTGAPFINAITHLIRK